jgi:hypothetical protein
MRIKHGSTIFLKLVIVLIGLAVLALCVVLIPKIVVELTEADPATSVYLAIVGVVSVIPFFFALYQAIRLLSFIDKNEAFSDLSVNALKRIKYSAISMSVVYATGMPFLFQIADADDAPGLVLLGMVIVAAPMVIAVFAAVLQKLVENAIEIKSENDLTV